MIYLSPSLSKRIAAGCFAIGLLASGHAYGQVSGLVNPPPPMAGVPAIPGSQPPVTTLWQKLGVPQNFGRVRDGLLNRRGNFPGLEKKPPLLKIADPRNLAEAQPEMIKAAAEIKQAQDMKAQKLKALKFLADVNCGCYNKDGKVEKAFLEAMDDCDPEVRKAALEGLTKAAGGDKKKQRCSICIGKRQSGSNQAYCGTGDCGTCNECQSCSECDGCATTCCTAKIQEKLRDIAYGMTDTGCYKEPVAEIRTMAESLLCLCPPPAIQPEELIRPDAISREELIRPEPYKKPDPIRLEEGKQSEEGTEGTSARLSDSILRGHQANYGVGVRMSDSLVSVPSILSGNSTVDEDWAYGSASSVTVANPENLLNCRTVSYNRILGELVIDMPFAANLQAGWSVLVVDKQGRQAAGSISDVGGRRILVSVGEPDSILPVKGESVRFGIVGR